MIIFWVQTPLGWDRSKGVGKIPIYDLTRGDMTRGDIVTEPSNLARWRPTEQRRHLLAPTVVATATEFGVL